MYILYTICYQNYIIIICDKRFFFSYFFIVYIRSVTRIEIYRKSVGSTENILLHQVSSSISDFVTYNDQTLLQYIDKKQEASNKIGILFLIFYFYKKYFFSYLLYCNYKYFIFPFIIIIYYYSYNNYSFFPDSRESFYKLLSKTPDDKLPYVIYKKSIQLLCSSSSLKDGDNDSDNNLSIQVFQIVSGIVGGAVKVLACDQTTRYEYECLYIF